VAAYHSASTTTTTTTTTTGNTATTGTFHVTADNVIMANGCSGALELAFTALLDPGSILLVPKPGFPLYQVIAESHGATVVHYRLLPDQQWECDLEHLEELLLEYGDRVRGILVNNPGNPAGSVFGKRHLQELVRFCDGHRLPIVADEIYGDLTFGSNVFYPLAQVAAEAGGHVPVITASGVGKQYLIPGWRVGWIVFQDK
jgi:tyrosine aminotransferase